MDEWTELLSRDFYNPSIITVNSPSLLQIKHREGFTCSRAVVSKSPASPPVKPGCSPDSYYSFCHRIASYNHPPSTTIILLPLLQSHAVTVTPTFISLTLLLSHSSSLRDSVFPSSPFPSLAFLVPLLFHLSRYSSISQPLLPIKGRLDPFSSRTDPAAISLSETLFTADTGSGICACFMSPAVQRRR